MEDVFPDDAARHQRGSTRRKRKALPTPRSKVWPLLPARWRQVEKRCHVRCQRWKLMGCCFDTRQWFKLLRLELFLLFFYIDTYFLPLRKHTLPLHAGFSSLANLQEDLSMYQSFDFHLLFYTSLLIHSRNH